MKVRTLYLDTSVIGGCFDDEWAEPTRELFRLAGTGFFVLVTSVVAVRELVNAPLQVRAHFASAFPDPARILELNAEVESLAHAYIEAGVVTPKYVDDARHVAVATVHEIGIVVSWNFQHLVNLRREAGFNGVNLLRGFSPVRIVSPLELIHENDEEL